MQQITARGQKLEVGLGWFRFRRSTKTGIRFREHTAEGESDVIAPGCV
jgi:hypothetical protein